MFTGIITDVGRVSAIERRGDTRLSITTRYDMASVDIGASIACSGVCLTVVDKGPSWFAVDVSAETLARTTLKAWQEGTRVNLERPLRVGEEVGGHILTGHVDGLARVLAITPEGASRRFRFMVDKVWAPYLASKGSVALDGVSLTVNEVEDGAGGTAFGVNIIPHTQEATAFAHAGEGDTVNMEVDILARYVARLQQVMTRHE
ncbi:MAG: riboflavin synthase [Pseudomonadota bacterium]